MKDYHRQRTASGPYLMATDINNCDALESSFKAMYIEVLTGFTGGLLTLVHGDKLFPGSQISAYSVW